MKIFNKKCNLKPGKEWNKKNKEVLDYGTLTQKLYGFSGQRTYGALFK